MKTMRYVASVCFVLLLLSSKQTAQATMWSGSPCCSWDGCFACPSEWCSQSENICTDVGGCSSSLQATYCSQGSYGESVTECESAFGWDSNTCTNWLLAREEQRTNLQFYRGGVTFLNRSIFQYNLTQLTTLSIIQTDITEINDETFVDLPNIQSLTLSLNRNLVHIGTNTLAGLSALTTLDLTHNYITDLSSGMFVGLSSITHIDLSGNFISELTVEAFAPGSSLKQLVIVDNDIKHIDAAIFERLPELEYGLFLENNRLWDVGTSFQSMPKLTTLDMDSNAIQNISVSRPFANSSSLAILRLGGTELTSIASDMLYGLSNLEELSLANGQLTAFPIDALTVVSSTLEILDLSGNMIASLPTNAFDLFTSLVLADLSQNSITSIGANTFPANPPSGLRIDLSDNMISLISAHAVPIGACRTMLIYSDGNPSLFSCNARDDFFSSICPPYRLRNERTGRVGCVARVNMTVMGPAGSPFENCASITDTTSKICPSSETCGASTSGGDAILFGGFDVGFNNESYAYEFHVDDDFSICMLQRDSGALICDLPPGTGRHSVLSIVQSISETKKVDTGILASCYFEYGRPTVTSLSGCDTSGCARSGNDQLQIVGTNLGSSGANVFVNGLVCTIASQQNDTFVVCSTPKLRVFQAYDLNRTKTLNTVTIVQSNLATTYTQGGLFQYTPCMRGYRQVPPTETVPYVSCISCDAGEFSAEVDAESCESCDLGKYGAESHASSCQSCPIGTYQSLQGQTSCKSCSFGSYTPSIDSAECTECSFWYMGSSDCSTPVTLILFIVVIVVIVSIVSCCVYRHHRTLVVHKRHLEAEIGAFARTRIARHRITSTIARQQCIDERTRELRHELLRRREDDSLSHGIGFLNVKRMPWYVPWNSIRFGSRKEKFAPHDALKGVSYEAFVDFRDTASSNDLAVVVKSILPPTNLQRAQRNSDGRRRHLPVSLDFAVVSFLQRLSRHKNHAFILGFAQRPFESIDGNVGADWFAVTEYAECGSLANAIAQHAGEKTNVRTSWEERLSWCEDMARGLLHLHANGLSHANFHPGNCLLVMQLSKSRKWTLKENVEEDAAATKHDESAAVTRHRTKMKRRQQRHRCVKLVDAHLLSKCFRGSENGSRRPIEIVKALTYGLDNVESLGAINDLFEAKARPTGGVNVAVRKVHAPFSPTKASSLTMTSIWNAATFESSALDDDVWKAPELYVPFERLRVRDVGTVDIFSLGVVMAQLYAMQAPWDMGLTSDLVVSGRRPELKADGNAPKRFLNLIRRCWRHNPDGRPSCVNILRSLERMRSSRVPSPLTRGNDLCIVESKAKEVASHEPYRTLVSTSSVGVTTDARAGAPSSSSIELAALGADEGANSERAFGKPSSSARLLRRRIL